jgi:hypothetical protein
MIPFCECHCFTFHVAWVVWAVYTNLAVMNSKLEFQHLKLMTYLLTIGLAYMRRLDVLNVGGAVRGFLS